MKNHHLGLIFGAYRANPETISAGREPLARILVGIRANGGARKLLIANGQRVQDNPCVQRTDFAFGDQQRIDIYLTNARVLYDKPAESDEDPLE
jgi:hypothetical protein